VVRPVISATNNAYHVFTNAAQVFYLSEKTQDGLYTYLWDQEADEGSKKVSQQEIVSLIESNRLFFALMNEGIQIADCFTEDTNELAQSSMDLIKMNEVMLAKIKLLTEAGKVNEALDTALLNLRLGELLERDAQVVIVAMTGITVISRSLPFIDKIIDRGAVTPDRTEKLLKQLHELEKLRTGLENGYKARYVLLVNEGLSSVEAARYKHKVVHLVGKIPHKDYIFKPNATKKVLAAYWRDQIDQLKNPEKKNRVQVDMLQYRLPDGFIQKIRFALGENSLGKLLLGLCSMAGDTASHTEAAHKTEEEVLALEKKLLSRQQRQNDI
jgi:hypothetical protein